MAKGVQYRKDFVLRGLQLAKRPHPTMNCPECNVILEGADRAHLKTKLKGHMKRKHRYMYNQTVKDGRMDKVFQAIEDHAWVSRTTV